VDPLVVGEVVGEDPTDVEAIEEHEGVWVAAK
jgi:hypothetical protein